MSKDEIITRLNDITADLVAEIDQLKRERDDLRAGLEKELLGVYRERDRFRVALKKYGGHLFGCEQVACSINRCTCGLDAVLAAKEEPDSKEPPG